MRDEIVAYLENRIQELMNEAAEAENKGDIISAKCAIKMAFELNKLEIEVNKIEIRNIQNKINEMIKIGRSRRNS